MGWIACVLCLCGYWIMTRSLVIGYVVSGVGSTIWVVLGVSRGLQDCTFMSVCFVALSLSGCWICYKKGLPKKPVLATIKTQRQA